MRLTERSDGQVRIGVAVGLPSPFADELQRARERFGDPLARCIPPHITLLGPTVVEADALDRIAEHLANAANEVGEFLVHLRSAGTFRPVSEVVFVQVAQGIAECEILERRVRSGPLEQDLRFHYHPHVTVAHDIPAEQLNNAFEAMANYEASFLAKSFQLYECNDDQVWQVVQDFRLGGVTEDAVLKEIVEPPH